MVNDVRTVEKALGGVVYAGNGPEEAKQRVLRRSLFVSENVKKGETFTAANVRNIRPAAGLHTRHYEEVLGKVATCDIVRGTPLSWKLVDM